jgi:hypothetical protein
MKECNNSKYIQDVPLATEPGISLIILTPIKILQRNLNRGTFVVWEMKRNVSVVCVCGASNCWDTEQRSASQPGSVANGTNCISSNFILSICLLIIFDTLCVQFVHKTSVPFSQRTQPFSITKTNVSCGVLRDNRYFLWQSYGASKESLAKCKVACC